MRIEDLDPLLVTVVGAVVPKLLKGTMKQGDGITKDDFEQIFFRLLITTDIATANKHIKQLNQYLVLVGAVHHDENPGISVARIKRPPARITIDSIDELRLLTQMEKLFFSSLDELSSDLKNRLGQLLFSAIRHGGLLRVTQIRLLMNLLSEPPCLLNEHIWFEIVEHENQEGQIWNPDPLTLALLYNWYKDGMNHLWLESLKKDKSHPQWINTINCFFACHGLKGNKMQQKKLLNTINARLSLEIPPILVDCAHGIHDARTLHPSVYLRLITSKTPITKVSEVDYSTQLKKQENIQTVDTYSKIGSGDTKLLLITGQLLRSAYPRGRISKEIMQHIADKSSKCTPITIYLCRWISARLTHSNRWGNRYAAKSSYTRLRSIARRLIGWLGSEDPSQIGTQKLTEIYEEIIDSVDTPNLRVSIAKNLREFQEYLEDEFGVERIENDAPWTGFSKNGSAVDAKIILPEEYHTAMNYYLRQVGKTNNPVEKKLLKAKMLLLALGYRAGMRRKEGIGLRIKDIMHEGKLEILVRPHDERKLKSLSGNRRIPISVLFSKKEQEILISWLAEREQQQAESDDYLFYIPELKTPFINESLIFNHIHWLLQIITGDPKARYHHLRHSFASWRFWKWMIPRYLNYQKHYEGMEVYDNEQINTERRTVLGIQKGNEESQKVAYALAMSIGHSGPSMTLNHYVHSEHWMREIEFRRLSPILSSKTLANLANISARQVQKMAKEENQITADLMRERFIRKLKSIASRPDVSGWKRASDKVIPAYKREVGNVRLKEIDLWEAVQRYSYQRISLSELEERYCIDAEEINQVIDRAKVISQMKYPGSGHNTYRHQLPEWQDLPDPPIVFQYPHQNRHLEQVESAFKSYDNLSESRKKLIQWGLGYFLSNSSVRKSEIQFHNKKELRRFLRVVKELDYFVKTQHKDISRVRLIHFSSEARNSNLRRKQWGFWEKGLKLKKYQKKLMVKESATKTNGYIGLQVISLAPVTKEQRENKGKRQSDWGFRLSLYILALVHGWSSPETTD